MTTETTDLALLEFDMAREVLSQPDDWSAVTARLSEIEPALPRPGERVAVIGCGTSLFVAQAYARLREESGRGTTDAWPASDLRPLRHYDRVVAISRTGTTTEVVDALDSLPGSTPRAVITADGSSPVARLADTVALPEVDERAVVQTRFPTTVLALLRASLGHDTEPLADAAREVLAQGVEGLPSIASTADQLTFVGMGWAEPLAHEAALKLRESVQVWVESYQAMEYRHGPIAVAGAGRLVWALGALPPSLADDVRRTGAHVEERGLDPMVELVRVHLLCLHRAALAGLDPDSPRHLARSVVLHR